RFLPQAFNPPPTINDLRSSSWPIQRWQHSSSPGRESGNPRFGIFFLIDQMTGAKWLLIIAVSYIGVMALIYFVQRGMMYFPERVRTAPAEADFAEAEEIVLDSAGGERVIAWHVAPRGDKPVVLYFHGNGGALRYRVARFRAVVADGTGLVALSYRGYG